MEPLTPFTKSVAAWAEVIEKLADNESESAFDISMHIDDIICFEPMDKEFTISFSSEWVGYLQANGIEL